MRNTLTVMAVALLCAASAARAQEPAVPGPVTGFVDAGLRGTTTDGDGARYERYRDLRGGAFSRLQFGKEAEQYRVSVDAFNVGYRDQRYTGSYTNGRSRLSGIFDSIPLNYGYITSTPWVQTSTGVFTLNDAAQAQVQGRAPGVVGIPTTAAQLATPSIYRALAAGLDIQSRRDTIGAQFAHDVNGQVMFNVSVASYARTGSQPVSMSFAFNNANELPMPLDNRTNDVTAGVEYALERGMVRLAYEGSFFNNHIKQVMWDNPLRLTDTDPYDANGYSNGNGPAVGRMSVAPSNSMHTWSATALHKIGARSAVNGVFSFVAMNQNDPLIPWTSNGVINSAAVIAQYPGLARLPRDTAEAKVHGLNALVNFTSRPNRLLNFRMRYRFNDHNNLTPAFDATQYVRFDATPSNTGSFTQQFDIRQNTLDATGTLNLARYAAVNLSYILNDVVRTGRSFADMRDHVARVSVDTFSNQYVQVRGSYDHTVRIGSGFSEASIEEGGYQGGLRFYDEADRDSDKGTVLVTFMPMSIMDVTASFSAGRDVYKGEGHEFGLLDNDNRNFTVIFGVSPSDVVNFGASYGRDHFASFQKSRNANPPPDPTWTDPSRDWTLDNDENVNNVGLYLNVERAIRNTDVRLSYDYSDSDNGFLFGGPRIASLAAVGQFIPLPNITNQWNRLTVDVQYRFASKVGLGVGYWYEKQDLSDFATIDLAPGTPRIDYLGGLTTGYGNRPYTGQTVFARAIYFF